MMSEQADLSYTGGHCKGIKLSILIAFLWMDFPNLVILVKPITTRVVIHIKGFVRKKFTVNFTNNNEL